jgi:hypothetical protein
VARKAKGQDNKVVFTRLNRVWTDVQNSDWLSWLAETRPESMFTLSGPHIKGKCPFHDDSTASFVVTPYKGLARCFGCHKMFWNPIYFIAALNDTSVADALTFAKKRWGLSAAIPKELFEKVRDHEVYQRHKTTMMKYFSDLLFQALSAYGRGAMVEEHLHWAVPTVEYLLARKLGESARNELVAEKDQPNGSFDQFGVWVTICNREMLGIFPPIAFVREHFGETSEEYKFFRSYFGKYTEGQTYIGHLVFPFDDTPTSICRFKLREPAKPAKSQAWVEDNYEAEMGLFRGFYGLRYYRSYLSQQDHGLDGPKEGFIGYLSEGEFDVLCAIAQQIRRTSDDYIALALSGGGAQAVDRLTTLGISRAWMVPDRDRGGDDFVKHVLEETRSKTISFRVFRWPDEYVDWHDPTRPDARIKDPDDAIREIGYPRWVRYVTDEHAYSSASEWCYDQASTEISRSGSTDVSAINQIAKRWGGYLRDEQVCSSYCNAIAKDHGLDSVILRRDILVKDDNEEEFIKRLYYSLLENYHPVGIQNAEGRKRILSLWNKANRTTDTVVLNDERSAETFISRHYGPIYDFIAKTVGDPPFIVGDDEDGTAFNVTMKAKKYREYLNYSLLKMAKDLPSMDHAPMKAQGIHMIETTEGRMRSYMVNGRDVYCLTHDGAAFTTQLLDGPRHEGVIFDNTGSPWIESINGVADLAAKVDLVDLYARVRDMVETGWSFRYQQLDCTFLAAYVMCLAVMNVFTRQTAVILNAEHESGKSKFTAGFVGGSGTSRINVVAHALTMQGYTAASIRQRHNNTSLCLCLEEFEDYGGNDAKSIAVRRVLELCRDLISENAVNWSIGTTTGESRTYHLRFPLVACAIRPLRDAASLSRFVQFELVKDAGRIDPVLAITGKFGDALIKQTRHDMVVGLLPHMLALRDHQNAIELEYVSGNKLPAHASSRFREAMFPVLAMLRLLNELAKARGTTNPIPDYRTFAYDFAESRREQLARLKTTSENEQIFETILGSSIQTATVGTQDQMSGMTTIRVMLGDLNKLEDINKTKKGVYLDTKMEWLVVNWVEASQGLLFQSKYRTETPTFLKQVSERSPHYISNEQVKHARVLERLVDVMGPCQPIDLISVFSVKHLLDATRARRDEERVKPATPADKPVEIDNDKPQIIGSGTDDDDIVV